VAHPVKDFWAFVGSWAGGFLVGLTIWVNESKPCGPPLLAGEDRFGGPSYGAVGRCLGSYTGPEGFETFIRHVSGVCTLIGLAGVVLTEVVLNVREASRK
jgi:hypothetical protein